MRADEFWKMSILADEHWRMKAENSKVDKAS
jgi:hypothetical protein